jgi:hypothetical protein
MNTGDQVTLTRAMLGNDVGAIGYVFTEYPDFDDPTKNGVQIIFENGNLDGFSAWEQENYLNFLRHVPQYEDYIFNNVMQVERDFRKGYWAF